MNKKQFKHSLHRKALRKKSVLLAIWGIKNHGISSLEVALKCCSLAHWPTTNLTRRHANEVILMFCDKYYPNAPYVDNQPAYREKQPKPQNHEDFYESREWRQLRYRALKENGAACQCCGATAKSSGNPLHVDHIKPRSRFPYLQLEITNLQVLCKDCNLGKGAWDDTDWRDMEPELRGEELAHMASMKH